jgi:trigger factor
LKEETMQVKELKKEGLNIEMEVTLGAKELDAQVDERLQEYAKTMKLPGFRPGKVPVNILKQRYGRAVMGEVLEKAVNDSTVQVLKDKNLRPALQPKIEIKQFDEGKDLTYTMSVETLPEFKIADFKSLKVEKPVTKPEKKAVDEALERVAKQRQKTRPLEKDRATKKGDILTIDFKGRTEAGVAYPGMSSEDHRLELGSNQFISGFEEQLIGKNKGDKVEVKVTFPEPYHMAELAGQPAIFDVEVKDIQEAVPAEINDEFAKSLGFEDEKALREAVEKQMQSEYDQLSRMKTKRSLLDALDSGHDFEVPAGMLDLEFGSIRQQLAMERPDQAEGGELKLSKEEEEELKAIAERRVRLGLILSEVGRANNITVSDQELQRAVITEAQRFPGQEADVFNYYSKNRQALESLRAPVFEDKVVDYIITQADVSEKTVTLDELTAEDEESYLDQKKGGGKKASGAKAKKAEEGAEEAPKKKAAAKKKD